MVYYMRYIQDDEGDWIETEERDLDGEDINVRNANGYGACDIDIGYHIMTWKQLDKLKEAIAEAEKRWRT